MWGSREAGPFRLAAGMPLHCEMPSGVKTHGRGGGWE